MKNNQNGFSLIEVLIVVVILGFVLLSVIAFGRKIQTADSTYARAAETSDREMVLTNQIKKDFETVGFNLNQPVGENASGLVDPEFIENLDYEIEVQSAAANINRISDNNNNNYLQSAWRLTSGSSSSSFIPAATNSYFGFSNAAGNSFALFLGSTADTWAIFENTSQVFSSGESTETISADDLLTIALDNNNDSACFISYYRQRGEERRLLYSQAISCENYPFQAYMFLSDGSKAFNFQLRGTWFEKVGSNNSSNFARLPLRNGVQSDTPVWIDEAGEAFTVLASDAEIDPLVLLAPAVFENGQDIVTLTAGSPLRGTINERDYFLLTDNEARKSVLGFVDSTETIPNGSVVIKFLPASAADAAWGEFYSADADFVNYQFPVRSRLVKLSAPVTYRFVADEAYENQESAKQTVLRRKGVAPWEKVAFGLGDFSLSDQSVGIRRNYGLTFSTFPEEQVAVEAHRVSFFLSPSALNQ